MSDGRPHFSRKLAELREAAGLSQYALAQQSGLTKQALSRLEGGTRDPGWETVQKLALALGVDYAAFADPGITLPGPAARGAVGRPRKEAPAVEAKPAPAPAVKRPRGGGRAKKAPPAEG